MSNTKKERVAIHFDKQDEDEDDYELDNSLIAELSYNIEQAMNKVLDNSNKDGRLELLTILYSLSAQLSINLGVDKDNYIEVLDSFYEQSQEEMEMEKEEDNKNWN